MHENRNTTRLKLASNAHLSRQVNGFSFPEDASLGKE
jgi:hypothetical protein